MPEITSETPRTSITIAGETFTVPQPYAAGYALNANEASALNQTYAENIRNNLAKSVKEAKEGPDFSVEVLQGRVDDYCDDYEFGVRTGGGRTGDPVLQEAMSIARELVRKAIVKQGKALKDYSTAQISGLAKGALDKGDEKAQQILAIAKQRVAAAQEASLEIDVGSPEPEAPAPKGKKAAAATAEA